MPLTRHGFRIVLLVCLMVMLAHAQPPGGWMCTVQTCKYVDQPGIINSYSIPPGSNHEQCLAYCNQLANDPPVERAESAWRGSRQPHTQAGTLAEHQPAASYISGPPSCSMSTPSTLSACRIRRSTRTCLRFGMEQRGHDSTQTEPPADHPLEFAHFCNFISPAFNNFPNCNFRLKPARRLPWSRHDSTTPSSKGRCACQQAAL